MSFRVDDLKAELVRGFGPARSNRYRLLLPALDYEATPETMNILCDSVNMPGRQILTNERFTDMKARKVAYGFASEDIEVSFILTNDWAPWNYLYNWHQRVIGNVTELNNFQVNFKDEYTRDIEIEHLNYSNQNVSQVAKKVVLLNAYPTTVNAIELSNSSENEIIRVSASFSYDNWRRDAGTVREA